MGRHRLGLSVIVWAMTVCLSQAQEFGRQAEKVNLSDCSKAIQKSLRQEATKGKIGEIELKKENGVAVYSADVQFTELHYIVVIRPDGVLLSKILKSGDDAATTTNGSTAADGGEAEKKSSVKTSALPKKVQKTLKAESRGGEIDDLVKVEKGNSVCYRAEAEINERDYQIEIDDTGTLLKKVFVEGEGHESEDDDEDDD
jgi:uncharacterized membrane protein YkoI